MLNYTPMHDGRPSSRTLETDNFSQQLPGQTREHDGVTERARFVAADESVSPLLFRAAGKCTPHYLMMPSPK